MLQCVVKVCAIKNSHFFMVIKVFIPFVCLTSTVVTHKNYDRSNAKLPQDMDLKNAELSFNSFIKTAHGFEQ